jgi:hypothetical protein
LDSALQVAAPLDPFPTVTRLRTGGRHVDRVGEALQAFDPLGT